MVRDWTFWGLSLILILSIFACAAAQNNEGALAATEIDQKILEATGKYRRAQFEDAVIMTSTLLAKQDLSLKQETDALLILAMSEANRGQTKESRAYLERLSQLDPTVELNADEYPPQMMKIWFSVERGIPDSLRPSVLGPNALAVLYFDNSSISKDQKELDPLCKGLASMMIQDIAKSGTIKVVERDRINFLVDELKLQQSDLTDKNTAVKMGKLVGAKTLLMGGFMKVDNKHFKIYGRLVSVETGEIIKVAEVEGNPKDIFELEKELVFKILDNMNVEVDKEATKKIKKGKDAKYEALYHYSLGLALEDKDDYVAAYAEYKKALKLAPGYAEAEMKKNKLEPMALKG
jgi:TolB-like protein